MKPFVLEKDRIFIIPVLHYKMEMAALVRLAFEEIQPDCVAVELAETMQLQLLHAASRLPDISIVRTQKPLYYLCEPCDAAFEGLRSALEAEIPGYCIDLDVDNYPGIAEPVPDPYAVAKIGHETYYNLYKKHARPATALDKDRELYMAKRLKELSFSHERILAVVGMAHAQNILEAYEKGSFPDLKASDPGPVELCTLTEKSSQQVMAENAWITSNYEETRLTPDFPPDRQHLLLDLYKNASYNYMENTGNDFPGYHLRNTMKFVRNYALGTGHLMPDTFQTVTAAKGCVDHNYAYEV